MTTKTTYLQVKMQPSEREIVSLLATEYGTNDSELTRRLYAKVWDLYRQGTPLRLEMVPQRTATETTK